MKRRLLLLTAYAAVLSVGAAHATVATSRQRVHAAAIQAAPYISPAQLISGLLQEHFLPAARDFEAASRTLRDALAKPGQRWKSHRPAWVRAMTRWEILNAVAAGPLLERRSARSIDFWPTRPAQIQMQLAKGEDAMNTLTDMDRIGASARGLPALEWLLYKTSGDATAHRYALLLAEHVLAEAQTLREAFEQLAQRERDDASAWTLYSEWIGQAMGSLDQLRGKRMQQPFKDKHSEAWPRATSGQTGAAWAAQWAGLERFLMGAPEARSANAWLPVPGSLNSLLLGRGHLKDSANLERLVDGAHAAIARSASAGPGRITTTVQALTQLRTAADSMASEVLGITLGFTDADGD